MGNNANQNGKIKRLNDEAIAEMAIAMWENVSRDAAKHYLEVNKYDVEATIGAIKAARALGKL